MILNFINLKQAHTNTIQNIFEKKIYCPLRNVWENFSVKIILKSKNYEWVKSSKNKKSLWNAKAKLPYYITLTLDRRLFRLSFTNKLYLISVSFMFEYICIPFV